MASKKRARTAEQTVPETPPVPRWTRADLRLAALLAVATFLAYWPAIHGGMIMDDTQHITSFGLRSLDGLRRIWFDLGATSQYYPLLHSAFWVEFHLWGLSLTAYHVVNILLHIGSALLLVSIARRLEIRGAWVAGFLFALHPLCVESVAWISEQKNALSTFFYLAAALEYLKFDVSRDGRRYRLAFLLFVLALLSKSVTATLPAVLLVAFWWKRGRIDVKTDVQPLAPLLGIGAAMGLFTAWVERTYIGANGADFSLSIASRLIVAGRTVWFYLGRVAWPFGYLFVYPRWDAAHAPLWMLLVPVSVIAAVAGAVWLIPRTRTPLAILAAFLITQIPVLGLLNVYPFLYSYVWDHFLYLASPALFLAIAGGIAAAGSRINAGEKLRSAIPVALIVFLGGLTLLHARDFRDAETLYTVTLTRNPDAWLAHNNLGSALLPQKTRTAEAIDHFRTAIRLYPRLPDAHHNLASALASLPGHEEEAIAEYRAALAIRDDLPETHANLGRELALHGRIEEGVQELRKAVSYNPDFADAHMNLGVALTRLPGHAGEALDQLETALRIDPDLPGGHEAMETALAMTPGRSHESIEWFTAQVKAHPESAEAHAGLAQGLRNELGLAMEAIAQFREALRIRPDFTEARMSLADTLAQMPDRTTEAIGEYQAVLRMNSHFPEAHNNLGNALATTGKRTEAMREFEAAIKDDPSSADPHINLGAILVEMPGRVPDAVREFQSAARLNPGLAEAQSNLGYALLRLPGRAADALSAFEASLRIKPDQELQRQVEDLRKTLAGRQ